MSELDHPIPSPELMGWGDPNLPTIVKLDHEKVMGERLQKDFPVLFNQRMTPVVPEAPLKRYEAFLESKGFAKGSTDITNILEYVFGKEYKFYPQDTGSCVWSNTYQVLVERFAFEIGVRGDAEVFFGKEALGPNSIAPFMISYAFARQRANMKSGDGLYCKPMIESMSKDGFVMCSNPEVQKVLSENNASSPENLPEPRSTALYRKIQNWAYNDRLKKFGANPLVESVEIRSIDEFRLNCQQFKGIMQCSSIAITKKGTHRDGFDIHTRNTRDRWDHNMVYGGLRITSDGDEFARLSNRSWCQYTGQRQEYVYNIAMTEIDQWIRQGLVDMQTLGEFDLPTAEIPTIE